MSNDPRKNLENILNGNNKKEDIDEEKEIPKILQPENTKIGETIEKGFDKSLIGLTAFFDKFKNDKKYRIKFITIICVLIAMIGGYQILKPARDEATGLILDKEYTLTKNEKKGIKFMIVANEIEYNDYDDFKISSGYGLINKDNDTMDYCVCKVYLSDYSGTCLIVGDFKKYPATPINDIASVDYEDDVEQAVENALGDEIDKNDYKLIHLTPSDILEILGRNTK